MDTNVLHFLRVYLDIARKHNLVPYGPPATWKNVESQLKATGLIGNQLDHLKQGFASLLFLQLRTQEDCQVFVSRTSRAEIVHGLVEGRAHFKMAQTGMPYRMRQRAQDLSGLVRAWMTQPDYHQIRIDVDAFIPELNRLLGTTVSVGGPERQVLALLQVVLSNVYFDVIDGWLYAEALLQQVQEILTFDTYYRETINLIHNPGGQDPKLWSQVRVSLQSELGSILLVAPNKQSEITIPQAVTQNHIDAVVPEVRG